ncbi:MAG: DUF1003 domain-containing protein [Candidatus Woesearchaeota archaeon]|nr:MAG: DUF1003 domain-containing protein [Candidatus Woesearchaeota archaeon]
MNENNSNHKIRNTFKAYISKKHKLTFGQRAADKLTAFCGSWTFITFVLIYIFFWIVFNMVAFIHHWDPWPFIILNLTLSCLAALQAPIILMSQNREAERDRRRLEYDYQVNRKAEREIEDMQKDLEEIKKLIKILIKNK